MNHIQSPADGDQATELAIKAAGVDKAPRLTPEDIRDNIVSEYYFTAANGLDGANSDYTRDAYDALKLMTFCVLVLRNGFTVTGESACASPENFNAEIGKRIARENAVAKVWPLMGYELKQRLSEA